MDVLPRQRGEVSQGSVGAVIDFGRVKRITVPEGDVDRISIDGTAVWGRIAANYVSLGDSIAAGHMIVDDWVEAYGGESKQYGYDGRTDPTVVIPGCYTSIIGGDLAARYGAGRVKTVSFARSGDKVSDLIAKLDRSEVRNAVASADVVTVCIGANDILGPALDSISSYIAVGNPALETLGAEVDENLAALSDDSNPNSLKALADKLKSINASAKFIFTTVYNPYKYLWCDPGQDGFFEPLLNIVPEMYVDIDKAVEDFLGIGNIVYFDFSKMEWVSLDIEYNFADPVRLALYENIGFFHFVFDRVNGIGSWAEPHIDRLDGLLRDKILSAGPNFFIAETKAAFDLVPDRPDPGVKHYNDLVNVEFTRGFKTNDMRWWAMDASVWSEVTWKNIKWKLPGYVTFDPNEYFEFDTGGFLSDLAMQIVVKVIMPDIDPHPEPYGHEVIAKAFESKL